MKQHHILYRPIDLSGSPANAWFPIPTSWKGCREWFLRILSVAWICSLIVISGCTPEQHKLTQQEKKSTPTYSTRTEVGEASWYGPGFQGKKTANGEIFDQTKMTAAHPSLPMGTEVKVTNLDNNETVKVRINDRGPVQLLKSLIWLRMVLRRLRLRESSQIKKIPPINPIKQNVGGY